MSKCFLLTLVLALGSVSSAFALEIEGIQIPETVAVADTELVLNGAGVRSKLWIEVYVGALYLPGKADTAEAILQQDGPRRVAMHMLYDVDRGKLVDAWNDGFKNNNSAEVNRTIAERIERFNAFFVDTKEGDIIMLDYVPDEGTYVVINGKVMGPIEGKDFNDAMLNIWLGPKPPSRDLKSGMLGKK